ncbi:MAG TPA: helix-turn-helix domain-containing protein [bacterium]|nr:helix-turn-helix domain-containing protein [bacterium]
MRELLGVSQPQLAEMLGVHPMTVSKWERGVADATPYQTEMLEKFKKGAQKDKGIKAIIAGLLVIGVAAAVGYLLYKAVKEIGNAVKQSK